MPSLEERFHEFSTDVIDRLARMETYQEQIIVKLDQMNGTVAEHERRLQQARGAAAVLGLLGGAIASAFWKLLGRG